MIFYYDQIVKIQITCYRVDMWQENSKILFECRVKETGAVCLAGGWIELRQEEKGPGSSPSLDLKSENIFKQLTERLKAKPGRLKIIAFIGKQMFFRIITFKHFQLFIVFRACCKSRSYLPLDHH